MDNAIWTNYLRNIPLCDLRNFWVFGQRCRSCTFIQPEPRVLSYIRRIEVRCSTFPRLRASAAQEGGVVKRLYLPWRVVGCGLVLLNILWCAGVATAQLAVNPLSVSFGSVPTGTGASQLLVLSNSGGSV